MEQGSPSGESQNHGKLTQRQTGLVGPCIEGSRDLAFRGLARGRTGDDAVVDQRPDHIAGQNEGVLSRHSEEGRARVAAELPEFLRQHVPQPDDVAAYFIRGVAHAQLGRPAEAIADLETALELAQAAGNDGLAATIEETLEAVRPP